MQWILREIVLRGKKDNMITNSILYIFFFNIINSIDNILK